MMGRSRRRSRSVPGAFDIEPDRTETPTPVPQQSSREQAWGRITGDYPTL